MNFASGINTNNIYEIGSTFFLFLGGVSFTVSYLKVSIDKANRRRDQETIASQDNRIKALEIDIKDIQGERDETAKVNEHLKGQLEALDSKLTAAPEIATLTASIAKQHQSNVRLITSVLNEVRKIVKETADNNGRKGKTK
jgi:hypothetical protein